MTDRERRFVLGVVAAGVVLVVAAWLDTSVVAVVVRQAASNFDMTQSGMAYGIGSIILAGLVLAVAWIGWRCRSLALGVVYALVGGLFAFLLYLAFALGGSINGSLPVLPDPLATALGNLLSSTYGPLNGVMIVGATMVVIGVAQIVASIRERRAARRSTEEPTEPEAPEATIEDVAEPA
jgi:hypothetical protein